jgi:hypothetical protein
MGFIPSYGRDALFAERDQFRVRLNGIDGNGKNVGWDVSHHVFLRLD